MNRPPISPDFEIQNYVYEYFDKQGIKINKTVKNANLKEPFIVQRDAQFIPLLTKSHLLGTVNVTIHAYDLLKHQNRQAQLLNNALLHFVNLKNTRYYNWRLKVSSSGIRYLTDTETSTELSHGILTLELKLTR